jgi:Mn-containing catalase
MFMEALHAIDKLTVPLFGSLNPDDSVNIYFNMSSGPDADQRGPWNTEPAFKYIADPLRYEQQQHAGHPDSNEMEMMPSQSPSQHAAIPQGQSLQQGNAMNQGGSKR